MSIFLWKLFCCCILLSKPYSLLWKKIVFKCVASAELSSWNKVNRGKKAARVHDLPSKYFRTIYLLCEWLSGSLLFCFCTTIPGSTNLLLQAITLVGEIRGRPEASTSFQRSVCMSRSGNGYFCVNCDHSGVHKPKCGMNDFLLTVLITGAVGGRLWAGSHWCCSCSDPWTHKMESISA